MLKSLLANASAMLRRSTAVLALAGLLVAGCSQLTLGGQAGDTAGAGSDYGQAAPEASQPPASTDASAPESTDTSTPESTDASAPAGTDASSSEGDTQVAASQSLNLEQRHPTGVVVKVTGLSFSGGDILVDAEITNGSRRTATFHRGNYSPARLRLVDPTGQEYNFVETEDTSLVLDPGETLSGTLAFRGPLQGGPDQLYLVTNLGTDDVAGFDINAQSDSLVENMFPAFAVPLDLA